MEESKEVEATGQRQIRRAATMGHAHLSANDSPDKEANPLNQQEIALAIKHFERVIEPTQEQEEYDDEDEEVPKKSLRFKRRKYHSRKSQWGKLLKDKIKLDNLNLSMKSPQAMSIRASLLRSAYEENWTANLHRKRSLMGSSSKWRKKSEKITLQSSVRASHDSNPFRRTQASSVSTSLEMKPHSAQNRP